MGILYSTHMPDGQDCGLTLPFSNMQSAFEVHMIATLQLLPGNTSAMNH